MKRNLFALLAITSLATLAFSPVLAQGKMDGGKMDGGKMAHGKMDKMGMKSVYVCKACKTYYSATAAKKMMYKDPMGHKMAKMDKAPKGFMDGSKMKMEKGGKMEHKGKMDGGKM